MVFVAAVNRFEVVRGCGSGVVIGPAKQFTQIVLAAELVTAITLRKCKLIGGVATTEDFAPGGMIAELPGVGLVWYRADNGAQCAMVTRCFTTPSSLPDTRNVAGCGMGSFRFAPFAVEGSGTGRCKNDAEQEEYGQTDPVGHAMSVVRHGKGTGLKTGFCPEMNSGEPAEKQCGQT